MGCLRSERLVDQSRKIRRRRIEMFVRRKVQARSRYMRLIDLKNECGVVTRR
jgi:hypothetical protein